MSDNKFIENLVLDSLYALGDINGGLAHEINNPLTILVGQISLIKIMHEKGKLTPEQYLDKVSKIEDATKRVIALVEKMRSIPRSVTEKVCVPTPLSKIIDTNTFLIEYVCKKNNIETHFEIDDCFWDCIWEETTTALNIIVNNSIHYILNNGNENKKLTISARANKDKCTLTITPYANETNEKVDVAKNILKRYQCLFKETNNSLTFTFPITKSNQLVA